MKIGEVYSIDMGIRFEVGEVGVMKTTRGFLKAETIAQRIKIAIGKILMEDHEKGVIGAYQVDELGNDGIMVSEAYLKTLRRNSKKLKRLMAGDV